MKLKSLLATFAAITSLSLVVTSCIDDVRSTNNGNGSFSATFSADYSVRDAKATTRAANTEPEKPSIAKFYVHLRKSDGTVDRTWSEVSQVPADAQFPAGNYTLETYYGDLKVEGFHSPYYYGSTNFTIREGEIANPEVVASLANTMVSVEYTESFKAFFASYQTRIHSAGGAYIDFVKGEERPAYVKPGDVTMQLELVTTDGRNVTIEPAKIANAQPKTHYQITFDVNGGEVGQAQLIIRFDETTATAAPIIIDLSDELFSAEPPVVTPQGFEQGTPLTFTLGDKAQSSLRMDIVAMGGFSEVLLTTQSPYLVSNGWPAEIDLCNVTDAVKSTFSRFGFKVLGIWGSQNDDKTALVDFSDLVAALRPYSGGSSHTFSLVVKDKLGRVSDPVTLTVNTQDVVLQLDQTTTAVTGSGTFTFNMVFNGHNPADNMTFKMTTNSGSVQTLNVKSITDKGDGNFTVELYTPSVSADFTVCAYYKTDLKQSNQMTVAVGSPNLSLTYNEADVWSRKATLAMAVEEGDLSSLMPIATLYVSADGGNTFTKATYTTTNNKFAVTGLNPGTTYQFKVSVLNSPDKASAPVSITTEAPTAVPNGDFEQLTQEINVSGQPSGGRYRRTYLGSYARNTQDITVSRPTGWATTNPKTYNTAASNQNSWFVMASAYNSGCKFVVNEHYFSPGFGGETFEFDIYKFSAQSGSNAMRLRNVAYSPAGNDPEDYTWTAAMPGEDYYSKNVPSISNRAAGKLFLGTYSYSGGTETYNEGVSFTSRPASLSLYYFYTQDGSDGAEYGTVNVQLLNGSTVIGSGSAQLTACANYTQVNVPINYTITNAKATSLRIMISSSNRASTIANESTAIKTTNYTGYLQESYGAVLTIDNLTFNY